MQMAAQIFQEHSQELKIPGVQRPRASSDDVQDVASRNRIFITFGYRIGKDTLRWIELVMREGCVSNHSVPSSIQFPVVI
jgi:hypothetical protein